MSDYMTDAVVEQVAVIIDSDAFLEPDVFMDEYGGYPSWSSESQRARKRRARNQARAAISAVVPGIVQAAKAEAWDEALQARAGWMQDQRYYVEDEVPNPYRERGES